MDYRKSYILLWVLFAAALLMGAFLTCVTGSEGLGLGIGVLLMAAGIVQMLLFFRCPHCGALWDTRGGIPNYCPKCGKKIKA